MQNLQSIIRAAIEDHGSQAKLADAMGCSQQQISYLLKAKTVSAKMALRLEAATNGKASRHDLCPEIFGPAPLTEAS
jgi:DNA-binding transcriptional regulator YdaS (Cro superfamily)